MCRLAIKSLSRVMSRWARVSQRRLAEAGKGKRTWTDAPSVETVMGVSDATAILKAFPLFVF